MFINVTSTSESARHKKILESRKSTKTLRGKKNYKHFENIKECANTKRALDTWAFAAPSLGII